MGSVHSFLTKRWRRQDLEFVSFGDGAIWWMRVYGLAAAAGTEEDDLCEVVVHAAKFLELRLKSSSSFLGALEGVGINIPGLFRAWWKRWRRWSLFSAEPLRERGWR